MWAGTADKFYAAACGTEPAACSYTFAGDALPAQTYGTLIFMNWKPQNPLNTYPQWRCDPNRYRYIAARERTFHIGTELFLPNVVR